MKPRWTLLLLLLLPLLFSLTTTASNISPEQNSINALVEEFLVEVNFKPSNVPNSYARFDIIPSKDLFPGNMMTFSTNDSPPNHCRFASPLVTSSFPSIFPDIFAFEVFDENITTCTVFHPGDATTRVSPVQTAFLEPYLCGIRLMVTGKIDESSVISCLVQIPAQDDGGLEKIGTLKVSSTDPQQPRWVLSKKVNLPPTSKEDPLTWVDVQQTYIPRPKMTGSRVDKLVLDFTNLPANSAITLDFGFDSTGSERLDRVYFLNPSDVAFTALIPGIWNNTSNRASSSCGQDVRLAFWPGDPTSTKPVSSIMVLTGAKPTKNAVCELSIPIYIIMRSIVQEPYIDLANWNGSQIVIYVRLNNSRLFRHETNHRDAKWNFKTGRLSMHNVLSHKHYYFPGDHTLKSTLLPPQLTNTSTHTNNIFHNGDFARQSKIHTKALPRLQSPPQFASDDYVTLTFYLQIFGSVPEIEVKGIYGPLKDDPVYNLENLFSSRHLLSYSYINSPLDTRDWETKKYDIPFSTRNSKYTIPLSRYHGWVNITYSFHFLLSELKPFVIEIGVTQYAVTQPFYLNFFPGSESNGFFISEVSTQQFTLQHYINYDKYWSMRHLHEDGQEEYLRIPIPDQNLIPLKSNFTLSQLTIRPFEIRPIDDYLPQSCRGVYVETEIGKELPGEPIRIDMGQNESLKKLYANDVSSWVQVVDGTIFPNQSLVLSCTYNLIPDQKKLKPSDFAMKHIITDGFGYVHYIDFDPHYHTKGSWDLLDQASHVIFAIQSAYPIESQQDLDQLLGSATDIIKNAYYEPHTDSQNVNTSTNTTQPSTTTTPPMHQSDDLNDGAEPIDHNSWFSLITMDHWKVVPNVFEHEFQTYYRAGEYPESTRPFGVQNDDDDDDNHSDDLLLSSFSSFPNSSLFFLSVLVKDVLKPEDIEHFSQQILDSHIFDSKNGVVVKAIQLTDTYVGPKVKFYSKALRLEESPLVTNPEGNQQVLPAYSRCTSDSHCNQSQGLGCLKGMCTPALESRHLDASELHWMFVFQHATASLRDIIIGNDEDDPEDNQMLAIALIVVATLLVSALILFLMLRFVLSTSCLTDPKTSMMNSEDHDIQDVYYAALHD